MSADTSTPMPTNIPTVMVHRFRYIINDGVLFIAFGEGPDFHVKLAMSLNLAIDLHQQLGGSIAEEMRKAAADEHQSMANGKAEG